MSFSYRAFRRLVGILKGGINSDWQGYSPLTPNANIAIKKGRKTAQHFFPSPSELKVIVGTFSIRSFMGNCKPQTAKCHVTTALWSRLQFAVHVWTAGRASSGKWFTARFFATKNCTASRLKVWTSFLYPFAMCLLDFWSRINELLLIFGRLKWCTIFLSAVLTKDSILFQYRVYFFFYLVTEFIT